LEPVAGRAPAAVVVGATVVVGASVGGGATVVVPPAIVVVVVGWTTFTDVVAFEVSGPPEGPALALNVMPLAVAGTSTTRVWGAAESGVDHVHVIDNDPVTQDERPGVNDTSAGAPPPLVVMLTWAGDVLNDGMEKTAVTSTCDPAVGLDGAAVMVALMSPGVCALTGPPRSTRAAPRTPNAESTFFIVRTSFA